jgi:predicted  nucleic acid-binding Zn-ribbon protein
VPNPPGAKKRRKRLEAINSRLAKGKSELDDLEKQVSALRTWYEGLEGVEASMKEEEGAEHDGGKVKVEEMEDYEIDLGDEEADDDGGCAC